MLLSPIELVFTVEVLDPMVLSSRVKEAEHCVCDAVSVQVPEGIRELYEEPLVISGGQRQLFVTLGQFSIIRLERPAQIIVPVLDYAIPTKECCSDPGGCAEDPCALFDKVPFPAEAFTPTGCDGPGDCYQTL